MAAGARLSQSGDRLPSHRVLHLVADRAESGPPHSHVVGVETATAGEPRRWPLAEFVEAFRRGEHFYMASDGVAVEPEACRNCARVTITTHRRPTPI